MLLDATPKTIWSREVGEEISCKETEKCRRLEFEFGTRTDVTVKTVMDIEADIKIKLLRPLNLRDLGDSCRNCIFFRNLSWDEWRKIKLVWQELVQIFTSKKIGLGHRDSRRGRCLKNHVDMFHELDTYHDSW